MGRTYSTTDVLTTYERHPLSKTSILDRIRRQNRGAELPVNEVDLAFDAAEAITDQNHIGGGLGTLRLAVQAGISAADTILDLGCGLGGPLRLLAEVYGCRGHGVDVNSARISDAIELSDLTRLSPQVTFEHADILQKKFHAEYSVVWGQNSWIHFDEPRKLARIAASALRRGGRVAFEDVCLRRQRTNDIERNALEDVGHAWRSSFTTLDDWSAAFEANDLNIVRREEDMTTLVRHLKLLTAVAGINTPKHEITGWTSAHSLAEAGVLTYGRVVATLAISSE